VAYDELVRSVMHITRRAANRRAREVDAMGTIACSTTLSPPTDIYSHTDENRYHLCHHTTNILGGIWVSEFDLVLYHPLPFRIQHNT